VAYSINYVYDFMRYIVRKQRGVMLSIPEAMQSLDLGQLDAVETWFSAYGETQQLHDAIRKLRVYQPFTSDAAGIVTFPDDYTHLIGTPFTIFGSSVTQVTFFEEDEFAFALTNQVRVVSDDYPIVVNVANGFSIYPQHLQIGAYWYLRRPATPILAFTTSGIDGRTITYDPINSVQLEFSDSYINNIIARSLAYVGVNMNEDGVTAFAEMYNKETQ
jgi:hypothetical protein